MTMTLTTARVRRTCRGVRKGPGKGREQRMGRGQERGTGREAVKGKVLLNCMRQTPTQREFIGPQKRPDGKYLDATIKDFRALLDNTLDSTHYAAI
jgi:hypothetical protein